MSGAIITVENLSKKYLVGHKTAGSGGHRYVALRDVIGREIRNTTGKAIDVVRGRQVLQGDEVEEVWALKSRLRAGWRRGRGASPVPPSKATISSNFAAISRRVIPGIAPLR